MTALHRDMYRDFDNLQPGKLYVFLAAWAEQHNDCRNLFSSHFHYIRTSNGSTCIGAVRYNSVAVFLEKAIDESGDAWIKILHNSGSLGWVLFRSNEWFPYTEGM